MILDGALILDPLSFTTPQSTVGSPIATGGTTATGGIGLSGTSLAATTSSASANYIDLTVARDLGIGDDPALKVLCIVTTAFTASSTTGLNIQFQGSSDSTTWTTYVETGAITSTANLIVGNKIFAIDWPHRLVAAALPRYVRLNYSIGAASSVSTYTFTQGALFSAIVLDRDDPVLYPPGVVVNN